MLAVFLSSGDLWCHLLATKRLRPTDRPTDRQSTRPLMHCSVIWLTSLPRPSLQELTFTYEKFISVCTSLNPQTAGYSTDISVGVSACCQAILECLQSPLQWPLCCHCSGDCTCIREVALTVQTGHLDKCCASSFHIPSSSSLTSHPTVNAT